MNVESMIKDERLNLNYIKQGDRVVTEHKLQAVDLSPYLGEWENCNGVSKAIAKAILSEKEGTLYFQAFGVGEGELIDWGEVPVEVFTGAPDDIIALGFVTSYEFPDMQVTVCSNVKRGILVLQVYTTFLDGSQRQNYFTREFYANTSDF